MGPINIQSGLNWVEPVFAPIGLYIDWLRHLDLIEKD